MSKTFIFFCLHRLGYIFEVSGLIIKIFLFSNMLTSTYMSSCIQAFATYAKIHPRGWIIYPIGHPIGSGLRRVSFKFEYVKNVKNIKILEELEYLEKSEALLATTSGKELGDQLGLLV